MYPSGMCVRQSDMQEPKGYVYFLSPLLVQALSLLGY